MSKQISIHNVVASCSTNVKIPLSKLSLELEGTEYEPEQFPGLVFRIEEPKAAALIFNSGKIVCTGTKSPEEAEIAINKIIMRIQGLGINIKGIQDLKIQNIVASTTVNAELNLNQIAFELEGTEYEPEQFPGLVYRLEEPKVVFLLFRSGKVICTGGKSEDALEKSVEQLKKNLGDIGAL